MKGFYLIILTFCSCLPVALRAQHTVKNNCCAYQNLAVYKTFLTDIAKTNTEKLDKKLRKDYAEIINKKNTDLITELVENNFLFDSSINQYLGAIFDHILDKTGLDKKAFHFFVNRTDAINAYTYEDGTVVCNLGLLNIVETESQVAMVFCHELAHYLLGHTNAGIVRTIEKFNSPEFLEQVKEIKKEKYNTKKQLEDLLVTDLFNRRRHNRSQETMADSLGLLLFSKTGYGSAAVPQLFDLLDSSDDVTIKCTIRAFFRNENIAADESWFVMPKKMTFGEARKKEMVDTLKTHPDCAKRKLYAQDFFGRHPKAGPDFILSTKARLNNMKDVAIIAEAAYAKDKDRLSYYLYLLIQNDSRFVSDKSIKTEIFNLLVNFCYKIKDHSLAYVIDKPYITENTKDEYARLLKLLDDVDLKQMKQIAGSYYEKNKAFITMNEELNTHFNNLKQL